MLKVRIEQAEAGMVLARSIANPEKPEHTLLKASFELDADRIERLKSLKINSVWVNYPGLDFLDAMLDPQLIKQQQALYSTLKEEFSEAQSQDIGKIDYNQYVQQMRKLFEVIMRDKNTSAAFITEMQSSDEDVFLHGTTVASLALLIGMRSEVQLLRGRPQLRTAAATDLTFLGVGCLLHDIGKLSLPEELRTFHLSAQDHGSPEWQSHTEVGFAMIKSGLDATAGQIVLNHHQHYDGSGFPLRKHLPGTTEKVLPLKGEDIHIFCRIACLADRFDGFRYLPDGRVAPNIVALKRMKNTGYARWFDPELYKAFTAAMPAFCPGEQVTLNNGQTVVVTEVDEKEPCRPVVRPIDTKLAVTGKATPSADNDESANINLATRVDLHIAKVGDFDVTKYLH